MQSQLHGHAERLRSQSLDLASEIVDRHYAASAESVDQYGPDGRQRCLEDAQYHLRYLAEALEADSSILFADYIEWAATVLTNRNIPTIDLEANLDHLRGTLKNRFTDADFRRISPVIDAGIQQIRQETASAPQRIAGTHRQLAENYLKCVLDGRRHDALKLIQDSIAKGLSIKEVYLGVFQPVQYEIGWLWQLNRISVAQEHYATAVTQLVMSQLYPQTLSGEKNGRRMVCACVGGDTHEIGMRMVADLFELSGWDTHFFGANTPAVAIAQEARDRKADLVALSATMTYHLPLVRDTIVAIRGESPACIMVGGRPFNLESQLWKQVGADGCARDAESAADVADRILSGEST